MRNKTATSYGLTKLNESLPMICLYWGVNPKDVLGKKRITNIMFARHSLRYLLCLDKSLTLSEIGTLTNGDHASVIHSKKIFELYSEQDLKFQELKGIISGVLEYKKHSSRSHKVSEVIVSKLKIHQKVKLIDAIYED